MELYNLFGWIGAFGLLAAFFLNLFGKLSNNATTYKATNLVCAVLLTYNAIYIKAYPFLMIDALWAIVSFISLFKK